MTYANQLAGKSKLLIEQEGRTCWRVVQRECTRRGFSAEKFYIVGRNYISFRDALTLFNLLKQRKPNARISPT